MKEQFNEKTLVAGVIGELEDLGLEQADDGVEVCPAIAVLHEEPLSEFVAVGRADHRPVSALGVVVERGHPQALLEVRGGHDLDLYRIKTPLMC